MIRKIFLSFVPLFIATDALGVLPMFIALTHRFEKKERRRILLDSVLTAYGLSLGFIFLGKALFSYLGITSGDFIVAGGIILFILAVNDLITPKKIRRMPVEKDVGIVPIGTPLIAGPAVLTTLLLLLDAHGIILVVISISLNIALAGIIFALSEWILRIIGESGSKVLSKVASLFLAAIAVMMIRKGIMKILLLS